MVGIQFQTETTEKSECAGPEEIRMPSTRRGEAECCDKSENGDVREGQGRSTCAELDISQGLGGNRSRGKALKSW